VELKRGYLFFGDGSQVRLNRTKVELKLLCFQFIALCGLEFESNQSGIETKKH